MKEHLELRIELINPYDKNGVYNPRRVKRIDYITVSVYDLSFLFFKTLIDHVELLFKRNGILPED